MRTREAMITKAEAYTLVADGIPGPFVITGPVFINGVMVFDPRDEGMTYEEEKRAFARIGVKFRRV